MIKAVEVMRMIAGPVQFVATKDVDTASNAGLFAPHRLLECKHQTGD